MIKQIFSVGQHSVNNVMEEGGRLLIVVEGHFLMNNDFHLVSSQGAVLFYIAVNPDCTIQEIADAMSLTRRTIWGLIAALRRARMVHLRQQGRRHHYTINLDAPFLHPTLKGYTLRPILGEMVEQSRRA